MSERVQKAQERYRAACHAMQSGVKMEMELAGQFGPTHPKHLRVGVNSSLVNSSTLANLLIKKGLIIEEEYHEALADGMEAEVKDYEERISRLLGGKANIALV